MKRLLSRVISLAAVLAMLPAPAAAAAPPPPIVIEAPLFQGGSGSAFYLRAAREYEKLRPDVKVDLYLDPRIQDKVQVRFLEGTFFETTNVGMNYWPLIRNGDVVQVDKYLDGPSWDTVDADGKPVKWRDTFLPGSLDTYAEDGRHYGIPLAYYATVVWYNKRMFREHGWQTPGTWDELFALCEQAKRAGVAPMAFQGRFPYYATYLYDSVHYHLAGPNGFLARQNLAPGSIAAAESVRAIELTRTLAERYFQPGALGMSHTESQLQFFLGNAAMIPCGAWLKSEMLGKIPQGFELGCFNLPIVAGGKADPSAVRISAEPFIVFSKSKHPEACVDFLRFITSRQMAGLFARMQDVPTCVRGANEGNLSKDLDDLVKIVSAAKASYGAVPGGGYSEMLQVYADMMYDAIANPARLTPQQVADKYERRGEAVRTLRLYPEKVRVNHRIKPAVLLGLLALGLGYWLYQTVKSLARQRRRAMIFEASLPRMRPSNVLLFVGPALLLYSTFVIVPSVRSFSWSLHEWNGLTSMSAMPFRGLMNFKRLLLESDAFWIALKNNLWLMFVVPLFVVPLSMFLAACISRGVWGGRVFRVVFFFPNLVGGIAASLLWLHLYNPRGGVVNVGLAQIGKGLTWLGWTAGGAWFASWQNFAWLEPQHLYWALIPISIWGAVGFNMVLYLAAMEGVDESYYEAATLDGAGKWRQFWTITVPLIWDVLAISIVFLVIGGMKAFDVIWLLTNQRPQTDNHVIATRMVQTMFTEFRVGEAAALAVLLFLMVFVGSAATLRGMRREGGQA
ncbi:MAG TPA: extracellular solute-binding protein [Tepidisphaeraceae bacterium]|nr:extracellular solute-binding protein [Tepidisphaeraceae bacterium]